MQLSLPNHLDREIIRTLRGRRAQANLSGVLGYKFNQVYLFESGRRIIHWQDFEHYCQRLKRPLNACLKKHFHQAEGTPIHEILRVSLKSYRKGDVAKKLKVTASKLSRWLSGRSDPPLSQVIKIFQLVYLNFFEFIDEVVGPGKLESCQPVIAYYRDLKACLYAMPFTGAVAPALGLKKYRSLKKHQSGVIAKALNITVEEEVEALRSLLAAGEVELHDGLYKLKGYRVNTTQDQRQFLKICQYWSDRAARIPKEPNQKSLFGYRVFGASQEGLAQLRQAQIDYYHALTEIIQNENGPFDHVVVVNFHTFLPEEG